MKIANVNDWRTDPELITNGARCEIGDGRAFIVRRAGTRNRMYASAMVGIDTDDEHSVMQVIARTIVIGWEGFNDASGAPVPFDVEECVALFSECPELFDRVLLFAAHRANFRAREIEKDSQAVKARPGGARAQARTASN